MTSDLSVPGARAEATGEISFVRRAVDHRDAVRLLAAFYQEQVGRYGFAESVDLDQRDYAAPNGTFIVAYERGLPVGCGGCRWYDRTTATVEIKKTYLVPAARGRGIGRALLASLEHVAITWGAQRAILETGVRNTAALALFTGAGYEPAARYVPGRDPSINRAFQKTLAGSSLLRDRAGNAIAR
ncbi:GNAT family N-acetyltransferase [Dactylosporangium sp. McL0621]|uniref:GNAT family N-acetyltransferase n=1 Tax=Dactylosporangium sp. McL0621 TaxID=3415678 RepID=UPI003CF14639